MKKYDILKRDIVLQVSSFKNHARNLQFILAPAVALVSYLMTNEGFKPQSANWTVWFSLAVALITITCYLTYDILDASFQILALAERLRLLEADINLMIGEPLLFWETSGSERVNRPNPFEGVVQPLWCMRAYAIILIAALLVLAPEWIFVTLLNISSDPVHLGFVMLGVLYSIGSACLVIYVARGVEGRLRLMAREAFSEMRSKQE